MKEFVISLCDDDGRVVVVVYCRHDQHSSRTRAAFPGSGPPHALHGERKIPETK